MLVVNCNLPPYTGAFGVFEVTHDITRFTKAKIFEHIGKKTPMGVRFSTVGMCIRNMSPCEFFCEIYRKISIPVKIYLMHSLW